MNSINNVSDLQFADEKEPLHEHIDHQYWKLMIVDDDDYMHRVTRLALGEQWFFDRKLQFVSAYSAEEARSLLVEHSDVTVLLLDVIMEEEDSGLKLVDYIRETLGDKLMRIILRTGQPGSAPERSVIVAYDINDYKEKTELTSSRLFSTVYTSIRDYHILRQAKEENDEMNKKLQASIRESYETLTEISLWEDRNRIARDIHNIVGHTLTTAIIQIEAGKRLIQSKPVIALDKIELSQSLVRRGLEEIRHSVHHMAEHSPSLDLRIELQRIVDEVHVHTEAIIQCSLGSWIESELTFFQKKLICHALQEGITNGIKHGQSHFFYFRLYKESEEILFSLQNTGAIPSEIIFGFGLRNLRDQVQLIGGTLQLGSIATHQIELLLKIPIYYKKEQAL